MSKYIRLKDIKWRSSDITISNPLIEFFTTESDIESLPTIDIVRCKECKHKYVTGDTTQYYVCDFMDAQFDENGYCHHGERIDNE